MINKMQIIMVKTAWIKKQKLWVSYLQQAYLKINTPTVYKN